MVSSAVDPSTPIVIREARVEDALEMGRMMVTTWLAAHRAHIPRSAWERRREQWTPEVSAAGWARQLRTRDEAPDQCRACYLIAEERRSTIIAIAAGRVAATDPDGTVAEVGALYVHLDYQRRGLGRRLLQQLAACLASKGIQSLHIGVLTANRDACQFYETLGGQLIGERLFDEDGDLLPERVYSWPDITSLIRGQGAELA